jgi:DNA polymerase-3 subunit epsilon
MQLKLNRPIAFFDLETTGVTVGADRIVEIAILKVHPDGNEEIKSYRVNPEMPIPAYVTEIHGITDADVANEPTFKDLAPNLYLFLNNCDLAGFNSNKFDIPMLVEEFYRVGYEFDVMNRKWVDVQNIFHKMEQRTLVAAYKFYCQKELENAHSATADIKATYEVLLAQLERYSDLKNDVEFLHEFSRRGNHADLAGRFGYDDQNEVIFNFGKHKGKRVKDVLSEEPSYYAWMMKGDFAQTTKSLLKQIKHSM